MVAYYELIDFGQGQKLERFDEKLIIRPAPGTERIQRANPKAWKKAEATFIRPLSGTGAWKTSSFPEIWTTEIDAITLELRLSAGGQLGVFPEQLDNWRWLYFQLQRIKNPANIFNGFAYTGAATLFASCASQQKKPVTVCHVDASKTSVAWARKNAELSGLTNNPVRWIVDDVTTFLKKEKKRGRKYDGFILDPPAYGRAPGGKTWKLSRDLPRLFELMAELLSDKPLFAIISCHDPKITHNDLAFMTKKSFCHAGGKIESFPIIIPSKHHHPYVSGSCSRWSIPHNFF